MIPKLLLFVTFLFQSAFACAEDNAMAIAGISNPARSTGIQIGDVLKRSVTFESAAPPNIITKALPAKGSRNDEIELVESRLERLKEGAQNRYRLDLSYQVFAGATKPKVMALPAQNIRISGSEQLILPAWHFWYSPLVDISIAYAKANVQPQMKLPGIDLNQHAVRIKVFSVMLVLALIGLVYVNADTRWLPFCKGNFARAYKQIKLLSRSKVPDANRLRTALFSLHESFNNTYGSNVFANDIHDFIAQHPRFRPLHSQMTEFFTLSNQTLFSRHPQDDSESLLKLLAISKSLRDCERGV
ncbi:nonribosomal peptide synthetase MxaA [Methylotenera sp. G11]|uniref:nonribosomal peptide synthetase MxaA n=1 Tax=Methylotenera sp. G11 TaxID=1506585 RepID=UPI001F38B7AC|nr:nonribosomal peptide synthetase MxaA [Methylotenera sp. G11]